MRAGIACALAAACLSGGLAACQTSKTPCDEPACAEDICTSPCGYYESFGYCFEKTTRCCTDSDCPVGTCDLATRYCKEYEVCGCASDDVCHTISMDHICVSNHTACGICLLGPPACTVDEDCDDGFYCKGTYCQERCCG